MVFSFLRKHLHFVLEGSDTQLAQQHGARSADPLVDLEVGWNEKIIQFEAIIEQGTTMMNYQPTRTTHYCKLEGKSLKIIVLDSPP